MEFFHYYSVYIWWLLLLFFSFAMIIVVIILERSQMLCVERQTYPVNKYIIKLRLSRFKHFQDNRAKTLCSQINQFHWTLPNTNFHHRCQSQYCWYHCKRNDCVLTKAQQGKPTPSQAVWTVLHWDLWQSIWNRSAYWLALTVDQTWRCEIQACWQ